MSYIASQFRHPATPLNDLGLSIQAYEGALSTLCAGCGHDSISAAIVQALFEQSIPPHKVIKVSGIGCSSKTPTYFVNRAHGFNSVHGRMPSVATGANLANKDMVYLGISGDGDTASIGMGQFAHVVRRNVNMIYIVENNGCYGLTKGQDSATADVGSVNKSGAANDYAAIDLCGLAMELGCGFVARSFSGDKLELLPLIKAGIAHKGFALIDVISPCVTFNNNDGSSKSYDYVRDHSQALGELDFVSIREETKISERNLENNITEVKLNDGVILKLHHVSKDYNPKNLAAALTMMHDSKARDEIVTGLLYIKEGGLDLHDLLNTESRPLNTLDKNDLCPGADRLQDINKEFI